jgi:hypothetical protein
MAGRFVPIKVRWKAAHGTAEFVVIKMYIREPEFNC